MYFSLKKGLSWKQYRGEKEKSQQKENFAETFSFCGYDRVHVKESAKRGQKMNNTEHLLSKMNQQYQNFSKGQKKLAAYIRENYDKAAFLTAAKLGETRRSQ